MDVLEHDENSSFVANNNFAPKSTHSPLKSSKRNCKEVNNRSDGKRKHSNCASPKVYRSPFIIKHYLNNSLEIGGEGPEKRFVVEIEDTKDIQDTSTTDINIGCIVEQESTTGTKENVVEAIKNLNDYLLEVPVTPYEEVKTELNISFEEFELLPVLEVMEIVSLEYVSSPEVQENVECDVERSSDASNSMLELTILQTEDSVALSGTEDILVSASKEILSEGLVSIGETENKLAEIVDVSSTVKEEETATGEEVVFSTENELCEQAHELFSSLTSLNKLEDGMWVSTHLLAVFNSDFPQTEGDVMENAKKCERALPETAAVIAMNSAITTQTNVDVIIRGLSGRRSLFNRASLALFKDQPHLSRLFVHAQTIMSAFGTTCLDENEPSQSAGWVDFVFDSETKKVVAVDLRPALLDTHRILTPPKSDTPRRLFNVFHQLLAGKHGTTPVDDELKLYSTEDQIGSRFNLVHQLGESSLAQLRKQARLDYFGYITLCEALSGVGFNRTEQALIWKACAGILYLSGPHNAEITVTHAETIMEWLESSMQAEWDALLDVTKLYQSLYHWIIQKINTKLESSMVAVSSELKPVCVRVFDFDEQSVVPCDLPIFGENPFAALAAVSSDHSATLPIKSLFTSSGNQQFHVCCLGDRFRAVKDTDSILKSGLLCLSVQPMHYSQRTLIKNFPMFFATNRNSATTLKAVNEASEFFKLSEMEWESMQTEELNLFVSQIEGCEVDTIDVALVTLLMERFSSLVCRSRAVVLPQVARIRSVLVRATLEQESSFVLNNWSIESSLLLLKKTIASSEKGLNEGRHFSALKTKLESELKQVKVKMDRETFDKVKACISIANIAQLPQEDPELHSILKDILSFSNLDQVIFEKAKASALMRSGLNGGKADTYEGRKAYGDFILRFVQATPNLFDLRKFKTKQNPVREAASQDKLAIGPVVIPNPLARLKTPTKGRSASVFVGQKRPLTSALRLPSSIMRSSKNSTSISHSTDTPELHPKFFVLFDNIRGCMADSPNSSYFLLCKKNLCECFNYLLNAGYILTDEDQNKEMDKFEHVKKAIAFQVNLLLDLAEDFESQKWVDEYGYELNRSSNRLALLAFVLFAFGGVPKDFTEFAATLRAWMQRQKQWTEEILGTMHNFLFGLSPIFKYREQLHKDSKDFFQPEMVDQVWKMFESVFPSAPKEVKMQVSDSIFHAVIVHAVIDQVPLVPTAVNVVAEAEKIGVSLPEKNDNDIAEASLPDAPPVQRKFTEQEQREMKLLEGKRKHLEEWKKSHVHCVLLYDYSDPDGEETYMSAKQGEIVWIPLNRERECALTDTKEWIWVERYIPEDEDISTLLDGDGRPLKTEGYVPFSYVGYPGYESQPCTENN